MNIYTIEGINQQSVYYSDASKTAKKKAIKIDAPVMVFQNGQPYKIIHKDGKSIAA